MTLARYACSHPGVEDWYEIPAHEFPALRSAIIAEHSAGAHATNEKSDALGDSAYCAGLQAGFSFGQLDDNEGLRKALASREGYVKVLREQRSAGAQEPVARVHFSDGDIEYEILRPHADGLLYAQPQPMTDAARDVLAERRRHVDAEGWTPANDDELDEGELAIAAACYAESAAGFHHPRTVPHTWPFAAKWWKPTTPRRDLEKAGALILAEVERIDRNAAKRSGDAK